MKICVLGNSHVGSLKRAWDQVSYKWPDVELTFFAQRGDGLRGLSIADGRLVATNERLKSALEFTSGGHSDIDPNGFDSILIYGSGAMPAFQSDRFVSAAALKCSLEDLTYDTVSYSVLRKIRGLTDKFVWVGHDPLRARGVVDNSGNVKEYLSGINILNEKIYCPLNSRMVTQPIETIVNGKNTDAKYSAGSKRLSIGDAADGESHPEHDSLHMNDAFGKLWICQFLESL